MKLDTTWFARACEAHQKGIDHIYDYGIKYIKVHKKHFDEAKLYQFEPYSQRYTPNPFRFQYDLTVFIWVNYYRLLKEEIKLLRSLAKEKNHPAFDEEADVLSSTQKLYGISRADFMFAAGELRWPTRVLSDGSHHGLFIRDPWSQRRVEAISDESIKAVISFGGGGQGKTHVSLAASLIIFDYFIFTQKGARCMLSTVNLDKLNSVGWSYLCNLNSSTEKGMSLYAGQSRIAGDHTLARPKNKDKGGVFKGILIGEQMNTQKIIDKLTGSHGHPFISYILDEIQSTPDPPIMAAPNYTMHAGDFRILGSGNWGENGDTLDRNIKPINGWDSVNEESGQWLSKMQNGFKAIVLHFNNNLSPGMTDDGHTKYPHLPHEEILKTKYAPETRNMSNISYRRFWVGFKVKGDSDEFVISDSLCKENQAHLPLRLSRVDHSFFAFDSAPAERDRNLMLVCREGIDEISGQKVFGPDCVYPLTKATESIKYYRESSVEILSIAKKNNIISGSGIVDWTGRPAHPEILAELGFKVHRLVYNKGVPNGVIKDAHTGRIERPIRINLSRGLEFRDDVPLDKLYAHHVAENMISLGAWALREYIKLGRIRGINENIISFMLGKRSIEEELYNRKFGHKISSKYGKRFNLESKDEFKKTFGFSPDLLDCLFEMAIYMLLYRRFPLTPVGNDVTIYKDEDEEDPHDFKAHEKMWDDDILELEYE